MLNDLEKKAVGSVVDLVRTVMRETIGDVDRRIIFESAALLALSELRTANVDRDLREGAVMFFYHRLLEHGGDPDHCNRCLKFGERAFEEL